MSDKDYNERKPVNLAEALHGEIITNQALINLLTKKGIITPEELLEEIHKVQIEIEVNK